MTALNDWLEDTAEQLQTGAETTGPELDQLNQSLVAAIKTDFNYYGKSSIYTNPINTNDWSQGVSYTIASLDAGEYELVFSLAAEFPALSYTLEWRVTGLLIKGPYSEGGIALPGLLARAYSYPIVHGGGPLTLGIDMRIPQLGFDVVLNEAFFTLKRVVVA